MPYSEHSVDLTLVESSSESADELGVLSPAKGAAKQGQVLFAALPQTPLRLCYVEDKVKRTVQGV